MARSWPGRPLTWLSLSGRTIRAKTVTPVRGMGSARRIELHPLRKGVILAWSRGMIHLGEPPDTMALALSPFEADSPSVITSLPDQVWTNAGMFAGPKRPFGPRPLYAVAASGAIATASGEDYCILLQMPASLARTRICRAWRREPSGRLREPSAAALADVRDRGASLRALVAAQEIGPFMNGIEELRFDPAGRLWVRVVDSLSVYHPVWLQQVPALRPARYTWEVFGIDGRLERRVALPGRLRVMTIGSDAVWGAWDEDDGSVSIGCVALASRSDCP